jgi:hypothetical protein
VQQALKKQIITFFEPMYLKILNCIKVGFANITAREILDHLFITYGNIMAVDLENNFEQMRRAWCPQQPVKSIFKQIQDFADYSEAGGVISGHPQKIIVGCANKTQLGTSLAPVSGGTKSPTLRKLGHNLRLTSPLHTGSTRTCKMNMQTSGYHAEKADLGQTEDQMTEATIGDWAKLATPQQLTAG